MKGTTHFFIGAAIGVGASVHYPFAIESVAAYMVAATFSALSADLDGQNILNSKLTKVARALVSTSLFLGIAGLVLCSILMFRGIDFSYIWWALSGGLLAIGLFTQVGFVRDLLVCLIGIGLIYSGVVFHIYWLASLGVYIAIVPWLAHRGLSHTLWAALAWASIGRMAETYFDIEGLAFVATAGYLSHLIADSMTPSGVKWFYPFSKWTIRLRLFK